MLSKYLLGRFLLRYLLKMPHLCWAVLILYPLSSLCVALPPYLLQKMLDLGVAQRRVDLLQWYALWYFVFVLLEYWIGFLSEYSLGFLGIRAMTFLRKDVFSHMLRICPPYFDHQPIGKIQTRVIGDIDALGEAFGSGSIGLIGDFFTTCIVLGMMFYFSPILTLYVVLGMPLLIALLNILQAYARQAFRKIRHQIGVLNGFLAEYIGGMQVVRMLGQEKRTAESLSVYNREYRDANRQAIFADAALYSLIEAWSTFMIGLLLWSVPTLQSWWGMQTTLSAGIVVAFIQYVRRLFVPLRDLASKYTLLQAALVAAERIFLFLKEPIESLVVLPKSEDNPVKTDIVFRRELSFDRVSFAYRIEKIVPLHYVLNDVSTKIRVGEKIGILGATGSGKSTLLKILQRWYTPSSGQILLDGVDIQSLDLASWRGLFTVVAQDTLFIQGSIQDNLLLHPSAEKARMHAVLSDPPIAEFMAGIYTRLENQSTAPVEHPLLLNLHQGKHLSEGERQFMSLLRALCSPPRIVLLDEATSHIDSATEAVIQRVLDRVLAESTALVVAHRLATISRMDRLLIFSDGKIVEEGSPSDLLQRDGHYTRLIKSGYVLDDKMGLASFGG